MARVVVFVFCLLVVARADAAALKVAVLEPRTANAAEAGRIAGLADFIATEAARRPVQVVARADLVALLGFEKERQLLGCTDTACLEEIGGALGVELLLTFQVNEVGGVWLLSASLLDARKAYALGRTTQQAESERELVEAASRAVADLLSDDILENYRRRLTGAREVSRPWLAKALVGVGAAALVAGVVVGGIGVSNYYDAKKLADSGSSRFTEPRDAARWQLPVGDALGFGGALVAAGGGIWLWRSASAGAGGDGYGVGYSGRF